MIKHVLYFELMLNTPTRIHTIWANTEQESLSLGKKNLAMLMAQLTKKNFKKEYRSRKDGRFIKSHVDFADLISPKTMLN